MSHPRWIEIGCAADDAVLDQSGKADAHRTAPLEPLRQFTERADHGLGRGRLRSFYASHIGGDGALARVHHCGLDASAADVHAENEMRIVHVERNGALLFEAVMRAGCVWATPASSTCFQTTSMFSSRSASP